MCVKFTWFAHSLLLINIYYFIYITCIEMHSKYWTGIILRFEFTSPFYLTAPRQSTYILGYQGVIPLATSTPGTISWVSFNVPLNEYYHFIGCIIILGWARWPMKTILTKERLSDWTARYKASYRFSVADSKLF